VHECHCSVDPCARLLVDQRGTGRAQLGELRGQIGDSEGQVVHALAAPRKEAPDRSVVREWRQKFHAATLSEQQGKCVDALLLDALAGLHACPEQPLVAGAGLFEVAHGDADVMDAERGHARMVPRGPHRGSSGAIMQAHLHQWGGNMGLFDKVKEKASDALEQGKEAAQTQQLKLQLRKLEAEVEAASAALGAAAFDLLEAGTLSASHTLDALATRVREARAAVEAKKAEITSAGDDSSGSRESSTSNEG
jgi:hypothetical protein